MANENTNSPHSIRTRGHSIELFQMPQVLRPVNSITAVDLKAAAATSAGKFFVPHTYGSMQILAIGFNVVATGGAITTPGTLALYIDGVAVEDADENTFELGLSVATSAIGRPYELDLNRATVYQEPDYPIALADQLIELKVETQGVGAGAMSVFPYIMARVSPRNKEEYEDA